MRLDRLDRTGQWQDMLTVNKTDLLRHHEPRGFSDRLALAIVRIMRATADAIFGRRYGHRTVVLETIAAVPGMVAATLLHLKCLRRMIDDRGWIRTLMEEADNQRTHLMVFVGLAEPRLAERLLVLFAQGVFYNLYFLLYLVSPRTAHRLVGYFAEDSVAGYTQYLDEIEAVTFCFRQRFADWEDPEHFAFGTDDADLGRVDGVVDAPIILRGGRRKKRSSCYGAILLRTTPVPGSKSPASRQPAGGAHSWVSLATAWSSARTS